MALSLFRYFMTLCVCSIPVVGHAAVTTVQALDLGTFLMLNDDAQHEITINTNGSYSYDSGFVLIVAPQEGIFDLDGLDSLRAVSSVTASQNSPISGGTGSFEMYDFQTSHPGVTDADGTLEVTVGMTVSSSGTGTSYSDTTRTGSIQLTVNYL